MYGKTKDIAEAREDLQRLHEKDGIPPKQYEGPATYALTKEEKEIFFECLLSMKVPTGFLSNIKRIINMPEKKFQNLKSHDCHVIITQLLPVSHREAICSPQCNLSEGDRSRNHTKAKE